MGFTKHSKIIKISCSKSVLLCSYASISKIKQILVGKKLSLACFVVIAYLSYTEITNKVSFAKPEIHNFVKDNKTEMMKESVKYCNSACLGYIMDETEAEIFETELFVILRMS